MICELLQSMMSQLCGFELFLLLLAFEKEIWFFTVFAFILIAIDFTFRNNKVFLILKDLR